MIELRRRMALFYEQPYIPTEYQQVEWIEQSGAAYFSTGLNVTSSFELSARVYYAGRKDAVIFGRLNYTNTFSIGKRYSLSGMCFVAHNSAHADYASVSANDIWAEVYANSETNYSSLYREDTGELIEGACNPGSFPKGPLQVFPDTHYLNCKISYIRITGVLELIPCYRKSDLVAGMYDRVNDVFYTNEGAGEFLVGPNV